MTRTTKAIFALLITVVALSTACNRGKIGAGGGSLLDNDLLKRMPAGTVGFYTWDAESDSFKKYERSAWSTNQDSSAFSKFFSPEMKEVKAKVDRLTTALQQAGILTGPNGEQGAISKGTMFLSVDEQGNVAPLMIAALRGMSGEQAAHKFDVAFKANGIASERRTASDNGTLLAVTIPAGSQAPKGAPEKIYIEGKDKYIGAALNEKSLPPLFQENAGGELEKMKQSPAFQQALKNVPLSGQQFDYGYIDMAAAGKLLQTIAKNAPNAPSFDAAQLPFEALAFSRGMDDEPFLTAALPIRAGETQAEWIKGLTQGGKEQLLQRMSPDTILLLALNGSIVRAAIESAEQKQPGTGQPLELLKTAKVVALAARNNPMAPFPDLMVIIGSDKAKELQQTLSAQLEALTAGFGMSGPGSWNEKEMQGAKVRYTLTPLGIGLFLAQSGNYVLLASSEKAIKDSLQSFASGDGGLVKSLAPRTADLAQAPTPILTIYTNFTLIAKAADSLGGTLAMFTGGKSGMDKKDLDNLARMGSAVAVVDYNDQALRVRARSQAPKADTK